MTVRRALPLLALIVAVPFGASAQSGGTPGSEDSGGLPAVTLPACQRLLAMRDEVQRHGMAIQEANRRRASVQEACRLFKSYLSAEEKFVKGIEEHGRTCGAPPELHKQVKESHTKASQIGKEVCESAAQSPRPADPSLRETPAGSSPGEGWPPGDYYIRDELQRFFGR